MARDRRDEPWMYDEDGSRYGGTQDDVRRGSRYSGGAQDDRRGGDQYGGSMQSSDSRRSRTSRRRREPETGMNSAGSRGYAPDDMSWQYGDAPRNNRKRRKGGSTLVNILTILLLVIAIGVFAFASWKLWGYYRSYKAGENEYSSLNEQVTVQPDANTDASAGTADVSQETEIDEFGNVLREKAGRILNNVEELEDPQTVEQVKEEAATKIVVENSSRKALPRMKNPIDFDELKAINTDVMGWIRVGAIEGISYPIAQAADNDYYLHRTFRREDNFAGCIFLNCDNTKYLTDQNSLVYGHNMKNGSMFGLLKDLQDQKVYDSNPYFWIFTPDLIYQYHIYSCAIVSKIGDPYRIRFPEAEFERFIQESQAWSAVDNHGVNVGTRDRIVTLSTCTGDDSTRFIVQGVLEQIYAAE